MRFTTGLCMALLAAGVAPAEDRLGNPLEDHFRLTAGWFMASTSTDIRLDATTLVSGMATPGTSLSAEDDLGLRNRSDLADVEAELRMRKRHKVRFNYFQLNRKASAMLSRQIRFGDDLYQINDRVDSQLDISSFTTTYSYAILRRERFQIETSLGLQLMQFEAQARVPARNLDEEETQTGPVPALGVQATVRFNRHLHAEARAEYLSPKVGDLEGTFKTLRGSVWYRFNRNLAAGLGYALLDSEVTSKDPGDSGQFQFRNEGAELLFRASF